MAARASLTASIKNHLRLVTAAGPVRRAAHGQATRARGGNVASVETTGPSVDDAIDAALEKLDLDEDQVELEILSEGGDGEQARVRATPRSEVTPERIPTSETGEDAEIEWDEGLATAGREIVEDLLDYMGFPGDVDVLAAGKENGTPTLTLAIVDGESMGPMIPSERRIVHLTLAEHESVKTHSEGEGDNRRVIVEPTPEYVAQHGGPAERSERPSDRGGPGGPGGRGGGGFSRGGRGGPPRGRGGLGGGYRD